MIQGQAHLATFPIAPSRRAVDRFVCVLADTPEARQQHFAVRYRVFCEETGFENPDAFPNKAEHDRYDSHAKHFMVWDRQQQQWVGAMRLVDASSTRLPSEEIFGAPLDGLDERRSRSAEFSRLCILREYRRTTQATFFGVYRPEGGNPAESFPVLYKQADNEVLMRLLRASFAWRPAIEHCYFIVTGALARILMRLGIPLTQVGQAVEHRGKRIPFRYEVKEALEGMQQATAEFASIVDTSPAFVAYSDFVDGALSVEMEVAHLRRHGTVGVPRRIAS